MIVQRHKPECPVKIKWITAFKVKVTANVGNVNECLSGWYLLNCRTFCNQTCYSDTASWAGVLCREKKKVCYLQSHNEGWYDQDMTRFTRSSELPILWQANLVWWYTIMSQSVLWKKKEKRLLYSRSSSQRRFKIWMNVCPGDIF